MSAAPRSHAWPRVPGLAVAHGIGVHRVERLSVFLGCPVRRPIPALFHRAEDRVVLAWGFRPSARRAASFADRHRLPLWRLEDGFVRSVEPGGNTPLSIVVDDLGIYYDAGEPSRLEADAARELSDTERERARALAGVWRAGRVSKYNHAREEREALPDRYVLAIDQTWGDASIRLGRADAASFQRMLEAALEENPDCTVLLKVHPEVVSGTKRGHFDPARLAGMKRVRLLDRNIHPAGLLERAEAVYTVTSQLGFEGLLWNRPVRVFGMPFYAGWGLTRDELPAPERRRPVPLENLVHAALIDYPRYLDPETGARCEPERALEWMALQRRMRERFPPTVYATGFSPWKKPLVESFLAGSRVRFVEQPGEIPPGETLVAWGRPSWPVPPAGGVNLLRLEDGFLRSVGLGADLIRPLSWVADTRGIYYDATAPSDLEELLQTRPFPPEELARAARLRGRIVEQGVTKYNVGAGSWTRPSGAGRVILVPGQVESDASIRWGAPGIRTNLDLLRTVRQENPGAHVIYKPHPDVVAGLRRKGQDEDETRAHCDEWLPGAGMDDLLRQVDEVHVMTSLAGFEALLRDRAVVCYGQPFYAGWGLTRDREPPPRRTRRLTLDELVAGALIVYPAYLSLQTERFTTPERILDELRRWKEAGGPPRLRRRRWLRWLLRLRAN